MGVVLDKIGEETADSTNPEIGQRVSSLFVAPYDVLNLGQGAYEKILGKLTDIILERQKSMPEDQKARMMTAYYSTIFEAREDMEKTGRRLKYEVGNREDVIRILEEQLWKHLEKRARLYPAGKK